MGLREEVKGRIRVVERCAQGGIVRNGGDRCIIGGIGFEILLVRRIREVVVFILILLDQLTARKPNSIVDNGLCCGVLGDEVIRDI